MQFARPERVDTCLVQDFSSVAWLDEHQVAERLRVLRTDHSAWRLADDAGQFSLAGAQPKTALLFEKNKWGVPSGATPTSHILKPPTSYLDGHAENEHFCLSLARRLGLPTAISRVMQFADEIAIVVERYDRIQTSKGLARVHQEDFCQSLATLPMQKYENEGGPGVAEIVRVLRANSTARDRDIATFFDALAFNWIVGGTDAHAKNYSLLITAGGKVRLAPLYDIASALPYDMAYQKLKLAMRIGKKYRLRDIKGSDWRMLFKKVGVDEAEYLDRIRVQTVRIADEAASVAGQMKNQGISSGIVERVRERIAEHACRCRRILESSASDT